MYSKLPVTKDLIAKILVIRTMQNTVRILTVDFILTGTSVITTIPDNKTIINALINRPINSLPSNAIII